MEARAFKNITPESTAEKELREDKSTIVLNTIKISKN